MKDRINALGAVSTNKVEIGEGQTMTVSIYNYKEDSDRFSAEVSKMVSEYFEQYFTAPPEIYEGESVWT